MNTHCWTRSGFCIRTPCFKRSRSWLKSIWRLIIPIDPAMFQDFEVLKLEIHSRMAQAILRGKREAMEAKLRKQNPVILEIFDCTLKKYSWRSWKSGRNCNDP